MIEKYAERYCDIITSYDSTKETFIEAQARLQLLYDDLKRYRPYKNGVSMLKRMLMTKVDEEYRRLDEVIRRKINNGE